MVTPKNITSKAEASGIPVALAHMDAVDQPGRAYLGSPETVDGLIRTFMGGILDRYHAVTQASPAEADKAREDAIASDTAEAVRLAKIFTGQDAAFEPMGTWNTGGELAKWARERLAPYMDVPAAEKSDQESLTQAFAILAVEVYDAIKQFVVDGDEETVKDTLDALADDWTRLLLGMAPSNTYDHGGTEVTP